MRLVQASAVVAALLAPSISSAQSAYDYPWCTVYRGTGIMSCYFASRGQCMQTVSGIGGSCLQSPYYGHGPGSDRPRRPYRDY